MCTTVHCRSLQSSQAAGSGGEEAVEQGQEGQEGYVCQSQPLSPAQLAPCAITHLDFEAAVKKVQPSVRREGFATTPDVTWTDVGSLAEVLPA